MSNIKLKTKHNQIKPPPEPASHPMGPKVIFTIDPKNHNPKLFKWFWVEWYPYRKNLVWSRGYSAGVEGTQLDEKTHS
jgi:hypothetical protein